MIKNYITNNVFHSLQINFFFKVQHGYDIKVDDMPHIKIGIVGQDSSKKALNKSARILINQLFKQILVIDDQ